MQLVIFCNNTKENFSWETEKMNVKFYKNCENTGKILKISCVRCNFVTFDIHFLWLPQEIFFGVITDDELHHSIVLEKCKKEKNTIFFKLFWYKVFVH